MTISDINALLGAGVELDYSAKVVAAGGVYYFITLSQDDGGVYVAQLPDIPALCDEIETRYNDLKNSDEMGNTPNKYIMIDVLDDMSAVVVSTSFWG